jgi:hypothetical protein
MEEIEYFCKGTVLKRMMKCGKSPVRLCGGATKRQGPYFELTLQGQRQNGQRQALTGSGSAVQGRSTAVSQGENRTQPPRQTFENHPPSPSQIG